MKRFQEALKKMLKEHISKAAIELREKVPFVQSILWYTDGGTKTR